MICALLSTCALWCFAKECAAASKMLDNLLFFPPAIFERSRRAPCAMIVCASSSRASPCIRLTDASVIVALDRCLSLSATGAVRASRRGLFSGAHNATSKIMHAVAAQLVGHVDETAIC